MVRLELLRWARDSERTDVERAEALAREGAEERPGIACYSALRAAGARFETADEAAAFTVMNFALADERSFCFMQKAAIKHEANLDT